MARIFNKSCPEINVPHDLNPDLYEEDFFEMNPHLSEDEYYLTMGYYRICLVEKFGRYVYKIPIPYNDRDKDREGFDSNAVERNRYFGSEIAEILACPEPVGFTDTGLPIYKELKVDTGGIRSKKINFNDVALPHRISMRIGKLPTSVDIPTEWWKITYAHFGRRFTNQLITTIHSWNKEGRVDLHCDNVGMTKEGIPIITDYAGTLKSDHCSGGYSSSYYSSCDSEDYDEYSYEFYSHKSDSNPSVDTWRPSAMR